MSVLKALETRKRALNHSAMGSFSPIGGCGKLSEWNFS
jgi:hypothetical protein